jgi:hypothetical protein
MLTKDKVLDSLGVQPTSAKHQPDPLQCVAPVARNDLWARTVHTDNTRPPCGALSHSNDKLLHHQQYLRGHPSPGIDAASCKSSRVGSTISKIRPKRSLPSSNLNEALVSSSIYVVSRFRQAKPDLLAAQVPHAGLKKLPAAGFARGGVGFGLLAFEVF